MNKITPPDVYIRSLKYRTVLQIKCINGHNRTSVINSVIGQ